MHDSNMWRRNGVALALGGGLVTLATGCPLVEVDVEVREVRLTYADIAVEGVPAEAGGSVQQEFVFDDLGDIQELVELDADVSFLRVELSTKSGIASFDFVDHATVSISSGDPASTLPDDADVYLRGNISVSYEP
jgi:hypothetical protein